MRLHKDTRCFDLAFALVALVAVSMLGVSDGEIHLVSLHHAVESCPVSVPDHSIMPMWNVLSSSGAESLVKPDLRGILDRASGFNLSPVALHNLPQKSTGSECGLFFRVPKLKIASEHELLIAKSGEKSTVPKETLVTHIVHPGECLWTISKAYGVPIGSIMDRNGLEQEIILIGQELKIPIGELSGETTLSGDELAENESDGSCPVAGEAQPPEAVAAASFGESQFIWPVKGPCWMSSSYGRRFHPIYRKYKFHNGIDIAGRHGTPIVAVADGQVVFSGYKTYSGKVVYIKHANGLTSIYAHCSKLLLKKGSSVKKGQTIARMGRTGQVTGIHLHFGITQDKKFVNPMKHLRKTKSTAWRVRDKKGASRGDSAHL